MLFGIGLISNPVNTFCFGIFPKILKLIAVKLGVYLYFLLNAVFTFGAIPPLPPPPPNFGNGGKGIILLTATAGLIEGLADFENDFEMLGDMLGDIEGLIDFDKDFEIEANDAEADADFEMLCEIEDADLLIETLVLDFVLDNLETLGKIEAFDIEEDMLGCEIFICEIDKEGLDDKEAETAEEIAEETAFPAEAIAEDFSTAFFTTCAKLCDFAIISVEAEAFAAAFTVSSPKTFTAVV